MKKIFKTITPLLVAAFVFMSFSTASAATTGTPFGGATIQNGEAVLVSNTGDTDPNNDYSGLDYDISIPFDDITQLSYDYNVTDDDCGGGSPRFQLNTDDGNVFVYAGPSPTFTGCASGDQTTGNLIGNNDACRYDLSQIFPGTQCSTYAQALALLGSTEITGFQVVVDSGWMFADGEQTIEVDNVMINDMTNNFNAPTSKDQCKNGGWQNFSDLGFTNQGQCVSYVNHQ